MCPSRCIRGLHKTTLRARATAVYLVEKECLSEAVRPPTISPLFRSGCYLQARNGTLNVTICICMTWRLLENCIAPSLRTRDQSKTPAPQGQAKRATASRQGWGRKEATTNTPYGTPITSDSTSRYVVRSDTALCIGVCQPSSTLWRAGTRRGTALHAACPPFLTFHSAWSGYTVAWFMGILSSLGFFPVFCVKHLSDFRCLSPPKLRQHCWGFQQSRI